MSIPVTEKLEFLSQDCTVSDIDMDSITSSPENLTAPNQRSVAQSSHVDVPHRSSVVVNSTSELSLLSHSHSERPVSSVAIPRQTIFTGRLTSPSLTGHPSLPTTSPNSKSLRFNSSSGKLAQF
ncbi:hypothetical protein V6N12_049159 [Hibiscus sabdariffa]|uniref:Uncharacterized protein n=1 Tax=Hibiscus sabdariffa TaxID=183260 RepID=A0ABR2EJD2_9ROSI